MQLPIHQRYLKHDRASGQHIAHVEAGFEDSDPPQLRNCWVFDISDGQGTGMCCKASTVPDSKGDEVGDLHNRAESATHNNNTARPVYRVSRQKIDIYYY